MAGRNDTNTLNIGKTNPDAFSRLFWETKASEHPLPFEEKTFSRTSRIINFVGEKRILFEGAKVLDIGCGTGAFALPFAQRGASVTALDISDNMLKRLAEEAQRLHLGLVRPIRYSWKEIDIREAGLEGGFDIVLSAFSTAADTEEELAEMEKCSTQWCLYIASGKIRRTTLCEKILSACGAPRNPKPDIRNIKRKLKKMGRTFLFHSFSDTIMEERSLKQITEQVVNRLEATGKRPDPDAIFAIVSSLSAAYSKDSKVIECQGSVEIGLLLWRVDGKPF